MIYHSLDFLMNIKIMLTLIVIYEHYLPSMLYQKLYVEDTFDLMESERECASNHYIKDLNSRISTQEKILKGQQKISQAWRVNSDRVALLSNLNGIDILFKKWRTDSQTCSVCKATVNKTRFFYESSINQAQECIRTNQNSINVPQLNHSISGIRLSITSIRSESICRSLRTIDLI